MRRFTKLLGVMLAGGLLAGCMGDIVEEEEDGIGADRQAVVEITRDVQDCVSSDGDQKLTMYEQYDNGATTMIIETEVNSSAGFEYQRTTIIDNRSGRITYEDEDCSAL